MSGTLMFVYNADEGMIAALGDAVHKLLSPDTYPCSLCAISYGAVWMRPEWRAYLRSLPHATEFYHRPDFRRAYPMLSGMDLPAILLREPDGVQVLVEASELDQINDVAALTEALAERLGAISPSQGLAKRGFEDTRAADHTRQG